MKNEKNHQTKIQNENSLKDLIDFPISPFKQTIHNIVNFHNEHTIISAFKSEEDHRTIFLSNFVNKNEIDLIKLYPHINKNEQNEFNYFNSKISSCPPKFTSFYSPVKHILYRETFDGIYFKLRFIPIKNLNLIYNFSSQESRVNEYSTTLISTIFTKKGNN